MSVCFVGLDERSLAPNVLRLVREQYPIFGTDPNTGKKNRRSPPFDLNDPLIDEEDYQGVVDECWKVLDQIIEDPDQTRVDWIFNTIFSWFKHNLERNEIERNIRLLNKELGTAPKHMSERKLDILVLLFNVIPSNYKHRPKVLKTILEVAEASKQSKLLKGRLTELESWIETWKEKKLITEEDEQHLYHTAMKCCEQVGDKPSPRNNGEIPRAEPQHAQEKFDIICVQGCGLCYNGRGD